MAQKAAALISALALAASLALMVGTTWKESNELMDAEIAKHQAEAERAAYERGYLEAMAAMEMQ